PPATRPTVEIKSIRSTENSWEIEFEAADVLGASQFRVERSDGLGSAWEIVGPEELQLERSGGRYVYRLPILNEGKGFFRVTVE
ncbi:MAG: hypothetical protein ACXW3Z_14395, partial [Limisphaerales bacterium]